jgi:hypothetical protein
MREIDGSFGANFSDQGRINTAICPDSATLYEASDLFSAPCGRSRATASGIHHDQI